MEKRIIECVPNFSEGRNKAVIQQITSAIEAVDGVKLLDVDPGEATNRTVVTFVGEPEAVLEAAFQGVKKAAEVIDMRNHKGAHPRMGATDVCPLIPIAGITLEECAELARQLAKRIADEIERIMREAHDRAREVLSARGDQMRTMAEVLLERETVEGPAVDALLDGTWDQYVAEHPEEGGKPKTAPGQIDEDLVAEAAAAAAERESQ